MSKSKKATKDTKESTKQKVNWEAIIMEGLSNPGLTFGIFPSLRPEYLTLPYLRQKRLRI